MKHSVVSAVSVPGKCEAHACGSHTGPGGLSTAKVEAAAGFIAAFLVSG